MTDNIHKFLAEEQDVKVVEKIYGKVVDMLTPGESLEYIAVQKKPAVNISPDCIALTSKRIIFFHPKNLGLSMEFQDYLWKDIEDCHFKEGFLGAEFMIKQLLEQLLQWITSRRFRPENCINLLNINLKKCRTTEDKLNWKTKGQAPEVVWL